MASTKLTRTPSGAGNKTKWTYSAWIKRTGVDTWGGILDAGDSSNWTDIYFYSDNKINIRHRQSSSNAIFLEPNRLFRDPNAWFHIVVTVDTTQGTASDRVKLYVNGVQETSFASSTYPSQNYETYINSTSTHTIGISKGTGGGTNYFNGVLSHVHLCDGYAYQASDFGSTDSTTGEWKINTSPSVSYGTNGFFILKDGNSVTDQSGNSNNYTVGAGTLTKTEDCPSNVFCTMNPLSPCIGGTYTFENGNTTCQQDISRGTLSTLGMNSGKFYAEAKFISTSGSDCMIGIVGINDEANNNASGLATGYVYDQDGNKRNSGSGSSYGNTYTTGDIIGIAVDLDNNKIYFSKNGTWQDSGDPTSGSTGTGAAFTITAASSTPDGFYYFTHADFNTTNKVSWNFGNGYFGTTAVSSAGTNASGIGIFEYDVPANYTALSTKGLNL
jgi:hypothetical protein